MIVTHRAYSLPFVYQFTISKGTKTHQPIFVVCLEQFGLQGWGEAPAITYYDITVEKMAADLEARRTALEKFAFTDPERYWHYLHHLIPDDPFLVCALDIAGWDLFGKLKKRPLWQYWGLDPAKGPLTDYTIGIDTVDAMVRKLRENPWPVYKIKVGTRQDLAVLRALRAETGATIRVDANAGWSFEEARELLPEMEALGVELVEQPLAKKEYDAMRQLYALSSLPLIADESCVGEDDVARCAGCFHGINIKLTKCGGITPARRMIQNARRLGLRVMAGSMNESSIGSAAIANLNPLLDYVDMDGPLLLKEDLATGLTFAQGRVALSGAPGLGIEPKFPQPWPKTSP